MWAPIFSDKPEAIWRLLGPPRMGFAHPCVKGLLPRGDLCNCSSLVCSHHHFGAAELMGGGTKDRIEPFAYFIPSQLTGLGDSVDVTPERHASSIYWPLIVTASIVSNLFFVLIQLSSGISISLLVIFSYPSHFLFFSSFFFK